MPTTGNLVKTPRRSQNSYIFTGQGTSCHVQLGAIGEENPSRRRRRRRRDGTHAADKFSPPPSLPRASSVQALLSRVSLDGTADVARSRSTRVVCCSVVVAHSSPSFLPLNPLSLSALARSSAAAVCSLFYEGHSLGHLARRGEIRVQATANAI